MNEPNSACPICGEILGGKDSLVMTDEGWAHKQHGKEVPPEEPSFVPPSPIGERIVEVVTRMLRVQLGDAAEERARNIASYVITEFDVKERG